ncbi:J domain-containing protein [Desulforhopalus vacuolatus]|uniref:J domain-containing protein n=1 Tax=Desulforhopalus vacuolatus TaxID=40414 RepID=UPI0019638948|nr:J domain-containing protein [Desulforhopalus vacuolatus]MBM9519976.1 J domain-containing protein [Desulforhopalus vacuolatus]
MQQLIKRLEIIKAAISLEDEETISLHLEKIRCRAGEVEELTVIFSCLDALDYPEALLHITTFLNTQSAVTTWSDPEVAALKLELQGLERRLTRLSGERDEFLHTIDGFNRQYSMHLGKTISEILKLQVMLAGVEEAKHIGDKIYEKAREKAQEQYGRFSGEYEEHLAEPEPQKLNEKDARRLKIAYRKASRFCHPDMVADDLKEQAAAQFQELNNAYRMNDLARVEEILVSLENGGSFVAASEQMNDKEKLRTHIRGLRQRVDELAAEIERIQADNTWQLVVQLGGEYDAYFTEQEAALKEEMERLQQKFREMV